MSIAFLVTCLVIVATPGTGALYTIAAGLTRGASSSVLAAFACTLGTLPHLVAALTGLGAEPGQAFTLVQGVGVRLGGDLACHRWRSPRG